MRNTLTTVCDAHKGKDFRITGGVWDKNTEAIVVAEKTEEGKNVIVHKFPNDPKEKREM